MEPGMAHAFPPLFRPTPDGLTVLPNLTLSVDHTGGAYRRAAGANSGCDGRGPSYRPHSNFFLG